MLTWLLPLLVVGLTAIILSVYTFWMPATKKLRIASKLMTISPDPVNDSESPIITVVKMYQPQLHRFLFGWTGFYVNMTRKKVYKSYTWARNEDITKKELEEYQFLKFGKIIIK